ncbi:MAG TPA: beta-galactosidase, partial [Pirellulales bacterium]|nr:beta-galactosidase [Pirellulales bacterium]
MAGAVWFDDLKVEEGDQPTAFRPDWIDPTELYTRESQIPWFALPLEFRSSLDVVTPHVELARPYAGAAPRVLWAGFYNNARAGCELAERGDLTLDSVVLNASSVDAAGVRTLHEKCVEILRARLGVDPKLPPDRSPQVLLIEQGILELLNRQDRTAILERIAQGMGCVVLLGPIRVHDHPGAVATPKIKDLISAAEKRPQPGRGRVLTVMNVDQHPLWTHGTLGIETVYSDMLQAIYRSRGRPPADVRAAARPPQPVANAPWTATVYGRGASVRVRVFRDIPTNYSSLMDGYGTSLPRSLVAEGEAKADPAATGTVRCAMPPLPGGSYMLLAQMLDERKHVIGWSLVPLTVTSSVEIVTLDAGNAAFVPQQPLQVACKLSNRQRPIRNARLVTQIDDPRGRILSRTSAPLSILHGDSTLQLVLDLAHAESCAVRLQVFVMADNLMLAQRSLWLSSEQLMPRIDFHVGPYDDFNEAWSLLGADMTVGPPRPDIGLRPLPWLDLPTAMGENASYCDPRSFEAAVKCVTSTLEADDPWTVVGCILHDELNSAGFNSPPQSSEVEFFRRYLKETYHDLKVLNASWGTNYGDWSEIDAAATKIRFVTQSDRNPAPWADWHAASEQAAHRFYAALDERVRQGHPSARIGPSGTRDSAGVNGFDWWLLAHDFRFVCFYYGVHNEMYRSFAPKGHLMANWSHLGGAIDDPDSLRVRIWQDVFAQCGATP